ncbi:MAG: class I SAM-dependent methyltransferase, partial [Spirochaetia bacterium]|nr:class I SAM-dependent methyltransferase [Spirochaetia bacterium]
MRLDTVLEKNILPDFLIRMGIRRLLRARLRMEASENEEIAAQKIQAYVEALKGSPIAVETVLANDQHYQVPTSFFQKVLGRNLKYSSAYFNKGVRDLDVAENDMLSLTAKRAELKNGQRVLELGCGWGSLSLYMAKQFSKSKITGVSNSPTQKAFIDAEAKRRGLKNLTIITADMNRFTAHEKFDRVVSVEMFEHMRNYEALLKKVAGFLKSNGKLFIHIFTHKTFAYLFETEDPTDWMGRYFFSGGQMPSDHLLLYFSVHFSIEKHWRVGGTHYQKTAEAWLANMDRRKKEILPIFREHYGEEQVLKWWSYWRIFFLACSELWGFRKGNEWFVSHYLFKKRSINTREAP